MRVTLPSGTPAELATGPSQKLGLVLIPDVFGLRPLFDGHVARLAAEIGGPVIAPELWPGREHLTVEERLAAAGTLRDADVLGDAVAAADALEVDRVGILGFCMGGMYALKAAGTGRFHRAVSFYGMIRVPEAWRAVDQGEPLDALTQPGRCPVLAVVGTADQWTPPDDVALLVSLPDVEVVAYEGADHGFVHDPARPAHRPDDAADAWERATVFLTQP